MSVIQVRCCLDAQMLSGFHIEQDGYFPLACVTIGTESVVNACTNISLGAKIADGAVYGPYASSYEDLSEKLYTSYNQTLLVSDPSWLLHILITWLII